MDFALSAKAEDVTGRMWDFMREHVLPAEPGYEQWRRAHIVSLARRDLAVEGWRSSDANHTVQDAYIHG